MPVLAEGCFLQKISFYIYFFNTLTSHISIQAFAERFVYIIHCLIYIYNIYILLCFHPWCWWKYTIHLHL